MVGGFFLTSSPILDLEHFSQVILRIVLQIMPTPQNNPNHQVLFTASDGWGFFWISSPILDLEHFSQVIYELYYRLCPPQINPTIRCCSQHLMVGVFFLTSFPILDLEHFSQVILWIVLQIMPPPKLPQPSGAVHSIWWLGFFFDLFSYSGLRAFFTSDFTNCTTDYAPPQINPTIRCCSQHLMVGVFFWPLLLFWT